MLWLIDRAPNFSAHLWPIVQVSWMKSEFSSEVVGPDGLRRLKVSYTGISPTLQPVHPALPPITVTVAPVGDRMTVVESATPSPSVSIGKGKSTWRPSRRRS